jgi:hypothetical protein
LGRSYARLRSAYWHILEEDFELALCNARQVENVPGRKTDVSDAQWLCQLMEAGLLCGRRERLPNSSSPACRSRAVPREERGSRRRCIRAG